MKSTVIKNSKMYFKVSLAYFKTLLVLKCIYAGGIGVKTIQFTPLSNHENNGGPGGS
jgi:hypothetical protein